MIARNRDLGAGIIAERSRRAKAAAASLDPCLTVAN